jgi:hypothetical protein
MDYHANPLTTVTETYNDQFFTAGMPFDQKLYEQRETPFLEPNFDHIDSTSSDVKVYELVQSLSSSSEKRKSGSMSSGLEFSTLEPYLTFEKAKYLDKDDKFDFVDTIQSLLKLTMQRRITMSQPNILSGGPITIHLIPGGPQSNTSN